MVRAEADPTVEFAGYRCKVVKREYQNNGRLALELVDADDGLPVARATVNIPDVELNPGEVVIKNYAENEGLLEVLVAAGIVRLTGRTVELRPGLAVSVCAVAV